MELFRIQRSHLNPHNSGKASFARICVSRLSGNSRIPYEGYHSRGFREITVIIHPLPLDRGDFKKRAHVGLFEWKDPSLPPVCLFCRSHHQYGNYCFYFFYGRVRQGRCGRCGMDGAREGEVQISNLRGMTSISADDEETYWDLAMSMLFYLFSALFGLLFRLRCGVNSSTSISESAHLCSCCCFLLSLLQLLLSLFIFLLQPFWELRYVWNAFPAPGPLGVVVSVRPSVDWRPPSLLPQVFPLPVKGLAGHLLLG